MKMGCQRLIVAAGMKCWVPVLAVLVASALAGSPAGAQGGGGRHAISLGGAPKYPQGFRHFDYADPAAKKGGTLVLPGDGGYDTLNPFSLKGRSAFLLENLVFESLTERSQDEPFTEYGLLAEFIEPSADGLSLTYRLNPKARFSDGRPVTAEDVVFSFTVLRSPAASPFFRYYYQDIQAVEALDRLTVRLRFAGKNRELAMIAGQLPILPKHIYGAKDFGEGFVRAAVGSGPYRVKEFDFGKFIRYERNPEHWARALNLNVGRYNFNEILVKYYRDETVRLEGLKAGEFDYLSVNVAKQWAVDVKGDKWNNGWLVKEELKHSNNAGIQGFAFNLRRPIFQDRRVRKALALAFDFEWSNRTLFYGQYVPSHSFFSNSDLAARGLPSPAELKLLAPLRKQIPPEVFAEAVDVLGKNLGGERERLRESLRLLREAGWRVKDGALTDTATGQPLRFTVTLVQPAFQRVVEPYLNQLRKLGVQADMKVVDDAVYQRLMDTKDFDMVVHSFPESQSPGNEQREYWGSAAADQEASRNVIGIKNPAVDALVEKIVAAENRADLVTATQALDRVLWHEHYVVPQWYINSHRVTYWNKLRHPARLPLYYTPFSWLAYWWVDPAQAQALEAAIQANRPLGR
jgi:microcin C transport system substrate-binding protein